MILYSGSKGRTRKDVEDTVFTLGDCRGGNMRTGKNHDGELGNFSLGLRN